MYHANIPPTSYAHVPHPPCVSAVPVSSHTLASLQTTRSPQFPRRYPSTQQHTSVMLTKNSVCAIHGPPSLVGIVNRQRSFSLSEWRGEGRIRWTWMRRTVVITPIWTAWWSFSNWRFRRTWTPFRGTDRIWPALSWCYCRRSSSFMRKNSTKSRSRIWNSRNWMDSCRWLDIIRGRCMIIAGRAI